MCQLSNAKSCSNMGSIFLLIKQYGVHFKFSGGGDTGSSYMKHFFFEKTYMKHWELFFYTFGEKLGIVFFLNKNWELFRAVKLHVS